MEDVLHAVNDRRPGKTLDIENALHAQQIGSPEGDKHIEPRLECVGVNWGVKRQTERADVFVVTVDVMSMVMMSVLVMIFGGIRIGFGIQPALHIEALALHIVETGVEEPHGIDRAAAQQASAPPD